MNCYMIALPPGSAVTAEEVTSAFDEDNRHEIIPGQVWVVASDRHDSPTAVCAALGIWPSKENGSSRGGVVVKVSGYFGLFNNALWEKMALWRAP